MKCPKCGHESRDGAEFCGKCGQPLKLEVVCLQMPLFQNR
ncbi:MAG TPA: zinc ribbon domain-containing protein [Dehalococcoidia bacterium]|nr:zinc ribbon domain-containing protein [Dehalococcoidia bacterium]